LFIERKHPEAADTMASTTSFTRCIAAAKVPTITVHRTRKTCRSLLSGMFKSNLSGQYQSTFSKRS